MNQLRSGLVGRAILASRSPWLHEQEARAQGLSLDYELFDFDARGWADDELAPLVRQLVTLGFSGFNVTYPFKQAIIPLLDGLDRTAAMVNAVNTVSIRDGRLTGYNTDMAGFEESVRRGLPGADLGRVLQVGAGGAGSAVAGAMLALGTSHLTVADLDLAKAGKLVARFARLFPEVELVSKQIEAVSPEGYSGVVNASPVGMAKSPGVPVDADLLEPGQWVADIVYFPLETELLRRARSAGCRTLDGSGMVINQAALAFEIITGRSADVERMRRSFTVPASEPSMGS